MDARDWGRALWSFARHSRDEEFLKQIVRAGLRADKEPKAVPVNFLRAYPHAKRQTVPLGDVRFRVWNMDPLEQYYLASLAGLLQPERIFEIGTFDGATSLLLARMVPGARIYTLDLPPGHVDGTNDVALARVDGAGSKFRDTPEADRITQLYGDSRTFDFSPFYNKMDMVVVDGSHKAECVIPDSENALKMVSPRGVVVWDDYAPKWPDVVLAVDDAAKRHGVFVARLLNTDLALYDATRTKHSDFIPDRKELARAKASGPGGASAQEADGAVSGAQ